MSSYDYKDMSSRSLIILYYGKTFDYRSTIKGGTKAVLILGDSYVGNNVFREFFFTLVEEQSADCFKALSMIRNTADTLSIFGNSIY